MQISENNKDQEKITLKMIFKQNASYFECDIKEFLEKYIIEFSKDIKEPYSSLFILYSGGQLYDEDLKKPISEIIKPQDKKDRLMVLLVCQITDFDITGQDNIIIILSIESVKIVKLNGKRGEIIKDIIRDSSLTILDLKWCSFKYEEKEIDLNKKFDNIDNDDDKKKLQIVLTVNYTIPLIVNLITEKKEKYIIQYLLQDRIQNKICSYFDKNHLYEYDYDLIYENKKLEDYFYTIFYEIISEEKIQNNFSNETKSTTLISNDLEKVNTTNIKDNKVINDTIQNLSNNEIDERKIEIEIKIIKKSCFSRYKVKICNIGISCGYGLLIIISLFIIIGLILSLCISE